MQTHYGASPGIRTEPYAVNTQYLLPQERFLRPRNKHKSLSDFLCKLGNYPKALTNPIDKDIKCLKKT